LDLHSLHGNWMPVVGGSLLGAVAAFLQSDLTEMPNLAECIPANNNNKKTSQ